MELSALIKAYPNSWSQTLHTSQSEQYEKLYPNVEVHGDGEWWSAD